MIRNDLKTTEIYKNNKFQDHILFGLFESDPDDSAMRNAVDALFPGSQQSFNVPLGGEGRGSKRGSCVEKIQTFSFIKKWHQIGVCFFFVGRFLGRNGSCFMQNLRVLFFLRLFGSCWDMHGTCMTEKPNAAVYLENGSLLKGLKSGKANSPPRGMAP